MSYASVYDWYTKFSEGHEEVSSLLHAHVQPTPIHDVSIHCFKELILGKRRITVYDIASNSAVSVEYIWNLLFKKVGPRDFNIQPEGVVCFCISEHLNQFLFKWNTFREWTVTCDSSMEWHHKGSPPPKEFKIHLSSDKIMGSVLVLKRSESYWFSSTWYNN
jgi:hypothetical protein